MSSAVDPATVQTELRYRMALDLAEGRIHYTKNDRESAVSESESESDADTVVPPSYKYYWRTISSWKDPNGRRLYYKMCLKEDTCEICKSIPEVEAEVNATTEALRAYKEAAASIAGSSGASSGSIYAAAEAATASSGDTPQLGVGDPVYAKLLQKQQEVFFRSETIKRHLEQYSTQRQYLQERERNLPKKSPGDFRVIVYEDFVAQFDTKGQKVINLVFTFLWRDENGALQRKYINNFHTDGEKNNKKKRKQDAPFVIQVWKFHLKIRKYQRAGDDAALKAAVSKGLSVEFSEVTHILRTGDSGSHFHALVNVAFESSVYQEYSVKWETHTLCKRHAWNLCDAEGGRGKRLFRSHAIKGSAPQHAWEFAAILNECEHSFGKSRAYSFKDVHRLDKKEENAHLKALKDSIFKLSCEFQFFCINSEKEEVRTPGFIRMRVSSRDPGDNSEFHTYDLLKRPKEWGVLCNNCTFLDQIPTYHKKGETCRNKFNDPHNQNRVARPLGHHDKPSEGNDAATVTGRLANLDYLELGRQVARNKKKEKKERNGGSGDAKQKPKSKSKKKSRKKDSEIKESNEGSGDAKKVPSSISKKKSKKRSKAQDKKKKKNGTDGETEDNKSTSESEDSQPQSLKERTKTARDKKQEPNLNETAASKLGGESESPAPALNVNSNQAESALTSSAPETTLPASGTTVIPLSAYEMNRRIRTAQNNAFLQEHGIGLGVLNCVIDTLKTKETSLNERNEKSDSDGDWEPQAEKDEHPSENLKNKDLQVGKPQSRPTRASRANVNYAENDLEEEKDNETSPESIVATATTYMGSGPETASRNEPSNSQSQTPKVVHVTKARSSTQATRTAKSSVSSTKNKRIKASITVTEQNKCDKEWADVDTWTSISGGAFQYALHFKHCKPNSFFLMFCTAAATEQSTVGRNFLFLGKIVRVDDEAKTFSYKRMNSIRPANQYDQSCLSGTWSLKLNVETDIENIGTEDKVNHSDVIMYLNKLNSRNTLPKLATDRVKKFGMLPDPPNIRNSKRAPSSDDNSSGSDDEGHRGSGDNGSSFSSRSGSSSSSSSSLYFRSRRSLIGCRHESLYQET